MGLTVLNSGVIENSATPNGLKDHIITIFYHHHLYTHSYILQHQTCKTSVHIIQTLNMLDAIYSTWICRRCLEKVKSILPNRGFMVIYHGAKYKITSINKSKYIICLHEIPNQICRCGTLPLYSFIYSKFVGPKLAFGSGDSYPGNFDLGINRK